MLWKSFTDLFQLKVQSNIKSKTRVFCRKFEYNVSYWIDLNILRVSKFRNDCLSKQKFNSYHIYTSISINNIKHEYSVAFTEKKFNLSPF